MIKTGMEARAQDPLATSTRRAWLSGAVAAGAAIVASRVARAASADDPAAVRAAFAEGIRRGMIVGGSLLTRRGGATVFDEAFGHADLAAGRAFGAREVVALASISKPHAAATLLSLVETRTLDLDAPISAWLPALAELRLRDGTPSAPPTLRQLLSHTAGFPGLDAGPGWDRTLYAAASMTAAAEAYAREGLIAAPGARYAYGEIQYIVAAAAAEAATGQPFETLLRTRVADPLGARRTTYFPDEATLAAMPVRYVRGQDGKLAPAPRRRFRPVGVPFDPAAALVADADGVARLFQMFLDGGRAGGAQVLSKATVRLMQTVQPGAARYGLGLNLQWAPAVVRHGGATGTMAWADVRTRTVGVLLVQTPWRGNAPWSELVYGALARSGLGSPEMGGEELGR